MAAKHDTDALLGTLLGTVRSLVRSDRRDLSARQLAVFLVCYHEEEAQTVRGLAKHLKLAKPSITRALDRLAEFDFVRRKVDPSDRRSVLTQRTVKGAAFLRELKGIMAKATTA